MTDWHDDTERMAAAIATVARFLLDAHDAAERTHVALNARAKATGQPFDRRADSAEGAQGAYSVAISALGGAMGVDPRVLAADLAPAFRPIERATLPSELTDPVDGTS